MQAYRTEALHSFAFDANHTRAATLSAAPGGLHNGSCAAMHVRPRPRPRPLPRAFPTHRPTPHRAPPPRGEMPPWQVRRTDKFKGRRREDRKAEKDFGDFGRAFKFWAHFLSPRPSAQLRVLVGSEDPVTFREMPLFMRPAVSCAQLAAPTNQAPTQPGSSALPLPTLLVCRTDPHRPLALPHKPCRLAPCGQTGCPAAIS
eukprot:scaffold8668_cov36-Phaeocystis_antarctica.AAC.1